VQQKLEVQLKASLAERYDIRSPYWQDRTFSRTGQDFQLHFQLLLHSILALEAKLARWRDN
jgi:hypothetical protein